MDSQRQTDAFKAQCGTCDLCQSLRATDINEPAYKRFASDLDYRAHLSVINNLLCFMGACVVCSLPYMLRTNISKKLWFKIASVPFFIAAVFVFRRAAVERLYALLQRREEELADSDSLFLAVDGVDLHYKCSKPVAANTASIGMHLYHGFGSNLGTWEYTQSSLAQACAAVVTSADLTGFGLTHRPVSTHEYTTQTNGMFGRRILQHEMKKPDSDDGAARNTVLVGHSLGGLIAATETVRHPQGISAVILISAAIVGFTGESKQVSTVGWLTRLLTVLIYFWREYVARFLTVATLWCLQPFIFLSLRLSFRPKSAWINGLCSAYSKDFLIQNIINRYRLPQLVRGWEWGIIRFVRSRLTVNTAVRNASDIWMNRPGKTLTDRFVQTVKENGIRVLIIHGEQDQWIPIRASEKLHEKIPDSHFIRYPNCGHIAHEEYSDKFVNDVQNFLENHA